MKAEDKFRKLGLKKIAHSDCIGYWKGNDSITFYTDIHTSKYQQIELYTFYYISVPLSKAIHKQLKELGWI